jgi:hypothetical protein
MQLNMIEDKEMAEKLGRGDRQSSLKEAQEN